MFLYVSIIQLVTVPFFPYQCKQNVDVADKTKAFFLTARQVGYKALLVMIRTLTTTVLLNGVTVRSSSTAVDSVGLEMLRSTRLDKILLWYSVCFTE